MSLQPPTQDFVNQIDFTVTNISGSVLNNAFSLLSGNEAADSQSGVVPVIWTIDTAFDTPLVPDPTASGATGKWANYIWFRKPFAGQTMPGIIYTWNNSAVSDPTFLKWISTAFDDTDILAQLTTLTTTSNAALNAANTANSNSTNALNGANNAVIVANNASASVASATAAANAASIAAASASTLAQQANELATAAQTNAANAVNLASGNKTIAQITPSLAPFQKIEVNATATSLEYYNELDKYITLQEVQASGTSGTSIVTVLTTIVLNTKLTDTGALVTAFAGGAFTLTKGTYRIDVVMPVILVGTAKPVSMFLRNLTDTVNTLIGQVVTSGVGNFSFLTGVFTTDGTKSFAISAIVNTSGGFSALAGETFTTGTPQTFTSVTLQKIG